MVKSADYLTKPFGRLVVPEVDGTFRAEIVEFPGCIAVGDTASQALSNLENVAESWLEAALANGLRIPDPFDNDEFSGKLVVRLPKSLHKRAAQLAARDGVSLNQFIVSSIAQQVGGLTVGATFNHIVFAGAQNVLAISGQQYSVTSSLAGARLIPSAGSFYA